MCIKLKLSALKTMSWRDNVLRFTLGGLTTVATGLIANAFGPVSGGLFLAFPAMILRQRDANRKA